MEELNAFHSSEYFLTIYAQRKHKVYRYWRTLGMLTRYFVIYQDFQTGFRYINHSQLIKVTEAIIHILCIKSSPSLRLTYLRNIEIWTFPSFYMNFMKFSLSKIAHSKSRYFQLYGLVKTCISYLVLIHRKNTFKSFYD